ncbi:MAG TPA: aminotransferase class V-fold PLP-dependent enzyme [Candidatus Limnocylindrales bacterium]|nr:aminotransferase class V-fold PLP-dependent enzyme [Candidatus Limnocylindrales bacterium]
MTQDRDPSPSFLLDPAERSRMWAALVETIENYISTIRDLPASEDPSPEAVRARLATVDFDRPMAPDAAVRFAADALTHTQVHTPHPRYFGLFNPTPATMGIAGDALVAAFNPQLAVWRHNPFATEVERYLVRALGSRFGYDPATIDGIMASGGSEANHTALLTAITHAFPEFGRKGARSLSGQPVFYVSAESHHSFHKAARLCGIGSGALREIPVDSELRMRPGELEFAIRSDRSDGLLPFLVVGTAGTTNAGAIDPLAEIAEIARAENIWFHADAAWGGAAALVPELRPLLAGIERADSITVDAHKWLCAPMGAGIYLTRHPEILGRTFHISAEYVPPKALGTGIVDFYENSIHWSRRFIGLKIFLSFLVAGWEGYAAVLRRMTEVGNELRRELQAADWEIVNSTPLPICCFRDRTCPEGGSAEYLDGIVREVIASGSAWISTTRVRKTIPVLRACITSYRTDSDDLRILISALNQARSKLRPAKAAGATPEA